MGPIFKCFHWNGQDEILLTLPYALCRIIIIVFAFISLRSLPGGAYKTVPWTQNLPRI